MSLNPLSSYSVSHAGGAASAAPRLVLSQLANFGNVVGSTATFKGKILDPTKIADLKMKYQQFYTLVGNFFNIEGEVYSFILDPETQGEMKGFLKVRSTVLDRSNPAAPPKEVIRLFNLPLLAIQLSDTEFNELNNAYQAICEAQLGRKAPDGLKKSFSRQLNAQSLENRPFFGSEMLKGQEVNAFLNVRNATQLNTLLSLNKGPEEIEKIEKQLDLATKSGLVEKGHEPAVLLALFGIDPARLKDIFKTGEQPEKHWYSALGLGADTAKKNHAMAHRMIDKIIAECQAFSLDPQVQQEASRFFSDRRNLNIFQKQYNPPKVNDLDILFCGEKKEWKLHQEWLDHFNRFALNDQEKLDLLKSFNTWRGEDYRKKLAQEADPHQKDAYFQDSSQDPTDEELIPFLREIDRTDDQKAQKLKVALKASLKEGKTLKDLSLEQLVEKVGGSDLAKEVQKAAQTAQAQAGRGQLPVRQRHIAQAQTTEAQVATGSAVGSALPSQRRVGGGVRTGLPNPGSEQILGRSAQDGSSASVGGSVPPREGASESPPSSRRSSVDSSAGVNEASSGSSSPGSPVASVGGSSDSGSAAPQAALSQAQMQAEYDWIEGVYNTLHQGEVLDKGILSSLYGFEIGKDRSFLEDLFVQRRQLDPKIESGKFVETFEDSLKWAQLMLDQYLKGWIETKDPSFTTEQVDVLKSTHRVRPLLDALAQAYDPRITRPQELKLRSFAVLDKAKWDQDTLKGHREGIQSTLRQWGDFTFDASINSVAQELKTAFLSRPHANLAQDLGELNTRITGILASNPTALAIRYEKETKFSGNPSFDRWLEQPENAYDTLVAKESDSFKFKQALLNPDVKKAFLERCEEIPGNHMDFAARYSLLSKSKELYNVMSHYPEPEQAKFFEEFILSPQRVSFSDWLVEKEYAVAKKALEEFTKNQSEIFKRVFEDEDFKEFIVRQTKGPDFRAIQKEVFDKMNRFIRSRTDLLLAKTTTIDAVAQELRDWARLEDFRS
ncbi:MAG: hypothetical protein FJZ60_02290 [Chlamydiae bacterium]|nr:hypothetical protein [Chlamydiota bacterium]